MPTKRSKLPILLLILVAVAAFIALHSMRHVSTPQELERRYAAEGALYNRPIFATGGGYSGMCIFNDQIMSVSSSGLVRSGSSSGSNLKWTVLSNLSLDVDLVRVVATSDGLIATGSHGIYHSIDGVKWRVLSSQFNCTQGLVALPNGDYLAAGEDGLVRGLDHGQFWVKDRSVPKIHSQVPKEVQDLDDPTEAQEAARKIDLKTNSVVQARCPATAIAVSGKRVAVGFSSGDVILSEDGGTNWKLLPQPVDAWINAIAFYHGEIWATTPKFFWTWEEGHWSKYPLPIVAKSPVKEPTVIRQIIVDQGTIYFIGKGVFSLNRDTGNTWQQLSEKSWNCGIMTKNGLILGGNTMPPQTVSAQ